MPDNKQHSRKKNVTGSADVFKRGDGLGGGPSGNVDYSGRNNKRPSGSGGSPKRGGGATKAAIPVLLAALLGGGGYMSGLFGGGGSSGATPTPTPTPVVTPTPSSSTSTYHFGTAASQSTTYTDASMASVNSSVDSGARDKYTVLKGNGQDEVTIMVYMCGTDLESSYSMATNDINEMLHATLADNVNIILETGGTKQWKNRVISASTNQRWRVVNNGLQILDENLGRKKMTSQDTLADFIQYSAQNFPANRYMLIFWDHGGGSVTGYGYDQLYPNDAMSVDEIAAGLKKGGVQFDVIGFDACLMGNLETAIAVEPYADYLIASEETEPGTGWYYVNWLTTLSNNTSTDTLTLSKQIIDDFVAASYQNSRSDLTSLSIVDLAELKAVVPSKLNAFSKSLTNTLQGNNYQSIADSRSVTKEFAASNKLDQIDLIHFCKNLNTTESKALASAVSQCVKYNKTNNMKNAYGMSIWFPYRSTRYVNTMASIYNNIGFDSAYSTATRSFAQLEASGQIATSSTSNSLFSMLGGSQASNGTSLGASDLLSLLGGSSGSSQLGQLLGGSSAAQMDDPMLQLISAFLGSGSNRVLSDDLVLSDYNGEKVLALDAEDWAKIQAVDLNVWVDDGEGYIDLGLDSMYEFTDEGYLRMTYDGTWLALDNHVVAFYILSEENYSDDDFSMKGYIPAFLNDEEVHILVEFNTENPDGIVLGAQKVYETGTEGKGLIALEEGAKIDFICDYYDYDGNFNDRYYLGDSMTSDGDLTVSYVNLTSGNMLYSYVLTDIYNTQRWTPMLEY